MVPVPLSYAGMFSRLLVDMNLSPEWVSVLTTSGWAAVHWSDVGDPGASDLSIMEWAATHGHVVFTHDLDLGTMLALSHAQGPSVLQVERKMCFRLTWAGVSSLPLSATLLSCHEELWW